MMCNCGNDLYCKGKCKKCYMKEYSKKYYIKNIDKEKARLKAYKIKNKEAERERNIKWNKDNRDYINKRERDRYKNDPQTRISNILRRRLGKAIKSDQSHVKNLGCTIDELRKHLEDQFQEGMTWDNHGVYGWHIDHIKPLAKYNLEDEDQLKEACNYKNLQPLWAKDNLSKGANNAI